MATRTVGDWNGEGKGEAAEETASLDELRSALAESVAGQVRELATRLMESSGATAARVDGLLREAVLEAGRRGLERALEGTARTAKIGGVRPNGNRWEARTIDRAMAMDSAPAPLFDTREQAARHVFEHVMGED